MRKRKTAAPPLGYLTVVGVAKMLGLSTTTCYRRFPYWTRPSPRRVIARVSDVERFLRERKIPARQPYKEFA